MAYTDSMFILALFLLQTVSSPKELLTLHQQAEAAMRSQEYRVAEENYKKLIDKLAESPQKEFSWQNYVDSVLRCAEALIALEEGKEAETLLNRLLQEGAPVQYHSAIKLLKARTQKGLAGLMQSYADMREVGKQFPQLQWSPEMRLFFHATEITLNDHFDELLQKAERLAIAKEQKQALLLYQELEKAIQQERYPKAMQMHSLLPKKIRLAIAKLHYQLADYEQTIALTKETITMEDSIDCELLHLAAKAYSRALDYKKAISLLEQLISQADPSFVEESQQSLYEIATLYYKTNHLALAKEHFYKLQHTEQEESRLSLLASAALTQILIDEGELTSAKIPLSRLEKSNQLDTVLQGKLAFLQGQIALREREFQKAIPLFKRALHTNRKFKTDILHSLAYCYLAQEDQSNEIEKVLQPLLEGKDRATALLWLALHQLNRGENGAISSLLDYLPNFNLEEQIVAHLLVAKATNDPKPLFLVTEEPYAHSTLYSHGWFCRGLYELEQQSIAASIRSFETAFILLKKSPPSLLYSFLQEKEQLRAFEVLSQWRQQEGVTDDSLYLEALLYSYSRKEEEEKKALTLCNELLQGEYHDQALYLIAIINYQHKKYGQAKEVFLQLSQREQKGPLAEAGWYWAAESEEQMVPASSRASEYRQQLFADYPKTIFGAEAYFKFFPMQAYLQGESDAMAHLASFSQLFPQSTLRVAAYYLLALYEHNRERQCELLQEAISIFDGLSPACQQGGAFYFRSRALLTLSMLSLKIEPNRSIALLRPLLKEIEKVDPHSTIRLECRYLLAQAYANYGKHHRAQRLFQAILEEEMVKGTGKGHFLALTWHALGDLAFLKGDRKRALESYDLALQSGEGFLSEEETIELWVRQSQCR